MIPNCSLGHDTSMVPIATFLGQLLKLTYLGHYVPCYLLWPLVTSILAWPKKKFFFCKSYMSFNELSRQTRFSLLFLVFEIWRGAEQPPPPIPSRLEPDRNRITQSQLDGPCPLSPDFVFPGLWPNLASKIKGTLIAAYSQFPPLGTDLRHFALN